MRRVLLVLILAAIPTQSAFAQYQLHAEKSGAARILRPSISVNASPPHQVKLDATEFDLSSLQAQHAAVKNDNPNAEIATTKLPALSSQAMIPSNQKQKPSFEPLDYDSREREYAAAFPLPVVPNDNATARGGSACPIPPSAPPQGLALSGAAASQNPNSTTQPAAPIKTGGLLAAGGSGRGCDFTLPQLYKMKDVFLEAQKHGALIWGDKYTLWNAQGTWALSADGTLVTGQNSADILSRNPSLGKPDVEFAGLIHKTQYGGHYKPSPETWCEMPTDAAIQSTIDARRESIRIMQAQAAAKANP